MRGKSRVHFVLVLIVNRYLLLYLRNNRICFLIAVRLRWHYLPSNTVSLVAYLVVKFLLDRELVIVLGFFVHLLFDLEDFG